MKLLLAYSKQSGKSLSKKKFLFVERKLSDAFEVESFCSATKEEAFQKYQTTDAEVIVIVGGDGHFNNLLNALMPLAKKPKIGYLNFGTLGDVGRLFGLNGRLKHDLNIILSGTSKRFDVGEIRSVDEKKYFMYVACVGAFSEIPYVSSKKRLGRLSYYLKAIPRVFRKTRIEYSIDDKEKRTAPFVMLLNGTHMAGFKINKDAIFDDGEFELYETKNGLFNGLLNYLPIKTQTYTKTDSLRISVEDQKEWCLDGEPGPKGSASLFVNKQAITVFFEAK